MTMAPRQLDPLESSELSLGCIGMSMNYGPSGGFVRRAHAVQPGATRKPERLDENLAAAKLTLSPDDLRQIDDATASVAIHGARGTGDETYG